MPRSSRHKSHKQKHGCFRGSREHSDSEELLIESKRKEDPAAVRVSDSAEKRGPQKEKDLPLDYSSASKKRRKERTTASDSAASDGWGAGRCGGGGEERLRVDVLVPEKEAEPRGESFGWGSEKRQSVAAEELKSSGSSRKQESCSGRKDESEVFAKGGSGRVDLKRIKSDKDSGGGGRKEGNEHKDEMEKEEKGLRSIEDRKVQDARRERKSVDNVMGMTGGGTEMSRMQGIQTTTTTTAGSEEERHVKQETKSSEWQIQDELHNPELEKEHEKRIRRCDGSGDKDKQQEVVRDGEDNWLSSRDDHLKNGRGKSDHKDDKYRDKYRDGLDWDRRYQDDMHKDGRSRDRTMDWSDKSSESRQKKAKLKSSDRDGGPYIDDRGNRNEDNRERKRSSYDFEDRSDHDTNGVKSALSGSKLNSIADRGRSESHQRQSDVADHSTPSKSLLKRSPSSSSHFVKDHYRHGSKQAESRETVSEEMHRPDTGTAATREVVSAFRSSNRVSESLPKDKQIRMNHSHLTELAAETPAHPQYGRSPKSAHQSPPVQFAEKSPSSTSDDRRYSNRAGVSCLEVEEMGRSNSGSKDARDHSSNKGRGWELAKEHSEDDPCQMQLDGIAAPVGSTSHLASRSASLPPPPPFKHGFGSPSLLGSLEEDSQVASDRKSNNHFKRSVDPSMGRGQGNAFKGVPNWPSPVANGFLPFQHGPPPSGFHALMQQFPAPPLFGVRSSLELSHPVVSYPMHDANRFSGHARPFGWQTPDDSCPPQMHGWDRSNGVFGDASHIYGRPEWDQNRHLMSGRGWEMNADMWKGEKENEMAELPASKNELDCSALVLSDEHRPGNSSNQSHDYVNQPEDLLAGRSEAKRSDHTPEEISAEGPHKIVHEDTPKESKTSSSDSSVLCCMYLSMLDISIDLASPELYERCTSLMELDQGTKSATGQIFPEDKLEMVGSRCPNHVLRDSLFPAITGTVHQGVMGLYKNQKAHMRGKSPGSSFDGSKLDRAFRASGEGAQPGSPINEKDGDGISSSSKSDLFGDAKEHQFCTVSNTVSGHVVSANASQAFGALMPETVECLKPPVHTQARSCVRASSYDNYDIQTRFGIWVFAFKNQRRCGANRRCGWFLSIHYFPWYIVWYSL
ncbi:hypothetical protein AAC387_Pa05g0020 [Persea americana]